MKASKAAGIAIFLLGVPVIQGCFGVVATGTAASAVAAQDRRTPGTFIDDELIELKVLAAILDDERMSSQTHINATSVNGLVLLTGEAPGESLRTRITEIARGITKVRAVQNEIALEAPSTLIARASDTVVTGKVKAALLQDRELNAARVKVVTEGGIVYLMGLLKPDEADRATEISRRVAGVQRVVKVMEYIE
jgi:osmotically-inducible protein OsmY